jgi:hypothetical protein
VISRRSVQVAMPLGAPVSIAAAPVEAGKAYLLTGLVYAVLDADVVYCSIGVATDDDVTGPAKAWSATAPNLNPPEAGSFVVTGAWTGGAGTATLWCTKSAGNSSLYALSGSQLIAAEVGDASVADYP